MLAEPKRFGPSHLHNLVTGSEDEMQNTRPNSRRYPTEWGSQPRRLSNGFLMTDLHMNDLDHNVSPATLGNAPLAYTPNSRQDTQREAQEASRRPASSLNTASERSPKHLPRNLQDPPKAAVVVFFFVVVSSFFAPISYSSSSFSSSSQSCPSFSYSSSFFNSSFSLFDRYAARGTTSGMYLQPRKPPTRDPRPLPIVRHRASEHGVGVSSSALLHPLSLNPHS